MGYNLKHMFSYGIEKKVIIEDPRLWCVNIFFSCLVLTYICIILVWKQGGYAVAYPVSGSARIKLYEPSLNGCDMLNISPNKTCTSTLRPKTEYPYCIDYTGPTKNQKQRSCKTLSADAIQRRLSDSISMTTYATEYQVKGACNQSLPYCPITNNVTSQSSYYVTGIEDYTVSIFHTVSYAASPDPTAPKGFIAATDSLPIGKLKVAQPDLCFKYANTVDFEGKPTNSAPCYLLATKNPQHVNTALRDEYPLSAIIEAAGADLNALSAGQPGSVYRETGMMITLQIVYENFRQWSGISEQPNFYYNPVFQPSIGYSFYDKVWTNYPHTGVLASRWGILISTEAAGEIYQFRFIQLLQTVSGSLALFGVVGVIINVCLLKKFQENIKEEVKANEAEFKLPLDQLSKMLKTFQKNIKEEVKVNEADFKLALKQLFKKSIHTKVKEPSRKQFALVEHSIETKD